MAMGPGGGGGVGGGLNDPMMKGTHLTGAVAPHQHHHHHHNHHLQQIHDVSRARDSRRRISSTHGYVMLLSTPLQSILLVFVIA